jgi:hypothetical protein
MKRESMMKYILGTILALNISVAFAGNWSCRNLDVEITCEAEKCQVSKDFTPLDVSVNTNGNISIGMYTGVWEGKAESIINGEYIFIIGKGLKHSTATDVVADFLISLDTKDNIAFIKGFGYAMPMTCEKKA